MTRNALEAGIVVDSLRQLCKPVLVAGRSQQLLVDLGSLFGWEFAVFVHQLLERLFFGVVEALLDSMAVHLELFLDYSLLRCFFFYLVSLAAFSSS